MMRTQKPRASFFRFATGGPPWTRGLLPILLAVAFPACGSDAGDTGDAAATGDQSEAEPAAPVANAGTIRAVVNFTGEAPPNRPIDMSEEPTCAQKHPEGATAQEVVASGGKLANVFVYIKEGLTGEYPPAGAAPAIDQVGCVYHPHVLGVQVGQEIAIQNSDGILHNIKAAPSKNRTFNISQPTNMTSRRSFSSPEIMIPVQCDVHGWMQMYIGVVEHPYFGVSGNDGTVTIANLPPGNYTLEAWHEKYGVQTQQVTLAPDGTADVTFDYNAGMVGAVVPLGKPIDPHDHHVVTAAVAAAPASR